MAKDLGELLAAKDESHYGLHLVTRARAEALLRRAGRMVEAATEVLGR